MNWRSVSQGLLAQLVRPNPRPLGWGIVVALGFIIAETLLVLALKQVAPDNAFGALLLLGVLVISAGWDVGLAVAMSLTSALLYVYFHLEGRGTLVPAVLVFLTLALLTNVLVGQARLRAAEAEARRREADALAAQQAALRRVATMVARGAAPDEVYPVAVKELAQSLGVDHVTLLRFEEPAHCVVLASTDRPGATKFIAGERFSLDGDSVTARIRAGGAAARIEDYHGAEGELAARLRQIGIRSAAGVPLVIDGAVRAALVAGSPASWALPAQAEAHIGDFADLISTAIANAETRAELTASRARIVAAADQARRGFERDLHDGAQQRIVSLGLALRAAQAGVPEDQDGLRGELTTIVDGLAGLYADLQELSRGIHPAILSKGGLAPAIKTLARRSPVPVELDVRVDGRLPEPVEVAAYYVIAESLTNAAKHAEAEFVTVAADLDEGVLRLSVIDDGVGGATPGGGSGLVGLRDRVEALSGQLQVSSVPGEGTTVTASIPVG
ncbi:GAF domain-containing sensor histidine kinase [Mycolicibacterium confluentis]|uniref:GAF domain-containing sensor histidine kinase n=1 Tax=Mycolicibacterium confluentis TaxID=28047 RepID=UPI001F170550|nr:ATP-binding protein [Mycolicibacterium confluentis]